MDFNPDLFERIIFDASSVSNADVAREIVSSFFSGLVFVVVVYLLTRSQKFKEQITIINTVLLIASSLLVLILGVKTVDRFSSFRSSKQCIPYQSSICETKISRVLEVRKGDVRAVLKTDGFEVSRSSSGKHWFSLRGKSINKINVGECLYTVHSLDKVDRIHFAAVVNCELKG